MTARYIGIDTHRESSTIVTIGPSGRRCRQAVVETNPRAIASALKSIPGQRHLCLEEGEYSEWLYELCEPLVDEVVVVQPERVRGNKNDARDAWLRADELRRGELTCPVFKAPGKHRALREAVRCHQTIVGDVVRAKNRLRGVFRARGIQAPAKELYACHSRSDWLSKLPPAVKRRAVFLGEEFDRLQDVHGSAKSWLLQEAAKDSTVQLLATAPGLGVIRAAQVVAVVISPYRFRTSRQFWSYSGLAIVTRSSSDWVKDRAQGWVRKETAHTRGLNRNRNPVLKNVFKGAAITVIRQMPDSPLSRHYERLLAETKPNLARLTIARRIAAAVLAMWKNQEVYDPAKQNRSQTR